MRVIANKTDAIDNYPAVEFNSLKSEASGSVVSSGQTLNPASDVQVATAMAIYASDGDFYNETGTDTAYVLTTIVPRQAPISYTNGMTARFAPANSNTGAATININAIGSVALLQNDGTALEVGDLIVGDPITVIFDGAGFRMENITNSVVLDPLVLPSLDLTIAGPNNILTVTNSTHAIINSGGPSGFLDRIEFSGPIPEGYRLLLRLKDATRTVTVRDSANPSAINGNIQLAAPQGTSALMDAVRDQIGLVFNTELDSWVERYNNFFDNFSTGLITQQIFTSIGIGTWTAPAGVKHIMVQACGGGGGGGGITAGVNSLAGAGGGGGYGSRLISTPPASVLVTVGFGGLRGSILPSNGLPGGATSFGVLVIAGGGSGGEGVLANSEGFGGVGGTVSGATIIIPGQQGEFGGQGSSGGNSHLGFGGQARVTPIPAAFPGVNYGGGGAGARNGAAGVSESGGDGAPGIAIVTEYY